MPSSTSWEIAVPTASQGDSPGFKSLAIVLVAVFLTNPRTVVNWKGDLELRASLVWLIISWASWTKMRNHIGILVTN